MMIEQQQFQILLVQDLSAEILDRTRQAVRDFSGGIAQADDETLVIVKVVR